MNWEFGVPFFQVGQKYADDGVPAFFFKSFPESKFPDVSMPFGLDMTYSGVTDERLKELAHLTLIPRSGDVGRDEQRLMISGAAKRAAALRATLM